MPLASKESVGFLWSRIWPIILARESPSLIHQMPAREQWLPWIGHRAWGLEGTAASEALHKEMHEGWKSWLLGQHRCSGNQAQVCPLRYPSHLFPTHKASRERNPEIIDKNPRKIPNLVNAQRGG